MYFNTQIGKFTLKCKIIVTFAMIYEQIRNLWYITLIDIAEFNKVQVLISHKSYMT